MPRPLLGNARQVYHYNVCAPLLSRVLHGMTVLLLPERFLPLRVQQSWAGFPRIAMVHRPFFTDMYAGKAADGHGLGFQAPEPCCEARASQRVSPQKWQGGFQSRSQPVPALLTSSTGDPRVTSTSAPKSPISRTTRKNPANQPGEALGAYRADQPQEGAALPGVAAAL